MQFVALVHIEQWGKIYHCLLPRSFMSLNGQEWSLLGKGRRTDGRADSRRIRICPYKEWELDNRPSAYFGVYSYIGEMADHKFLRYCISFKTNWIGSGPDEFSNEVLPIGNNYKCQLPTVLYFQNDTYKIASLVWEWQHLRLVYAALYS